VRVPRQRLQQGHAQRPFALARLDVDVAAIGYLDKFTAPGAGIGARQTDRAIPVIAAGYQPAAVRQFLAGQGGKITQNGAALKVGRGHQQSTLNTRCGLSRKMGRG
jgi:hypothetical protein